MMGNQISGDGERAHLQDRAIVNIVAQSIVVGEE